MVTTEVRYCVVCTNCGAVFTPAMRSPLWWMAKQAADKGRLDAIGISGERCGCIRKPEKPEAPFRVFGYDDMCENFDVPCDTFLKAVRLYRKLSRAGGYVMFISGVSEAVRRKMDWM